jgi:hypothetical protein
LFFNSGWFLGDNSSFFIIGSFWWVLLCHS